MEPPGNSGRFSPLVVYGHALGDSDQHIANAIADNPKLSLLAVGLYGNPKSAENQAIYTAASKMQRRRKEMRNRRPNTKSLDVYFYDSETASVWGAARCH